MDVNIARAAVSFRYFVGALLSIKGAIRITMGHNCCVPMCYTHSKRYKGLKYNTVPKKEEFAHQRCPIIPCGLDRFPVKAPGVRAGQGKALAL